MKKMNIRTLISYILLSTLVLLLLSTAVQATDRTDYRDVNTEVQAKDILKHIENGDDVYLDNCSIVGELNVSKIKLKIVPNPYYNELANEGFDKDTDTELITEMGISENLRVIESNITIRNSIFEDGFNFSNVIFYSNVEFSGATFDISADFDGANFNSYANFTNANFNSYANFTNARFNSSTDFEYTYFVNTNFNSDANFDGAEFNSYTDFENAYFKSDANFKGAYFGSSAYFTGANFNGDAYFEVATFDISADFYGANFNGDAAFFGAEFLTDYIDGMNARQTIFSDVNFNSSADFSYVIFDSDAWFIGANFNSSADFFLTKFKSYTTFNDVNFNSSADFSNDHFYSDTDFENAYFKSDANFLATNFCSNVDFSGTIFNSSADFRGTAFNSLADVKGPETPDNIINDGESCEAFRKAYENGTRYGDADIIYYNYRKLCQDNKDLISLSKWSDIICWITCGYGVKPLRILYSGGFIVGVFTLLYWRGQGIYRSSDTGEKKSKVSFWDALYFSTSTFTTLGSADWYPTDSFRKWVTLEGLLGWIMLGIFMATLTNVMIRV